MTSNRRGPSKIQGLSAGVETSFGGEGKAINPCRRRYKASPQALRPLRGIRSHASQSASKIQGLSAGVETWSRVLSDGTGAVSKIQGLSAGVETRAEEFERAKIWLVEDTMLIRLTHLDGS